MSVKDVLQALGSWGITLKSSTPRELISKIEQNKFGHIAIIPGRINPLQYGDGLLKEARYVGVYRSTFKQSNDSVVIKGVGMAFWLGDEDDKGAVFETPVVLNNVTFPNAIRALLPSTGSVKEGNLYTIPGAGTYTKTHQWETPRKAISYVTDTYTTSAQFGGVDRIVEYRVNGDATIDAGPIENLYVTTPKAILVKKDTGRDMRMLGLQADMSMDNDVEDLTTRVVLLADGEGETMATGAADASPTGFVDIFGTPIKMTRLVSESGTPAGNANVRAQVALTRWMLPRQAIQIRTDEFDIKGDFACGDYIYVFDPEAGFFDLANEAFWRGQPINPIALRVKEMDWGVRPGWTVAFRKNNGEWLDLSEYYKPETGGSTIAVGEYRKTLAGNNYEPISFRPNLPSNSDLSIPAAPLWDTFSTGSYQPENGDWTKAAVYASWFQPNNQDGSVITDGGHYEIRYRVNSFVGYGIRWGVLAGHNRVFSDDFTRSVADSWGANYTNVGGAATEYFVDGTRGVHSVNALNSSRSSIINGVSLEDLRIVGPVSPSVTAVGGTYRGGFSFRRDVAGNNFLRMEARFNTDGTYDLILARVGGAGSADLVIIPSIGSYTPGQKFWILAEMVGTAVRGKIWTGAITDAPGVWTIDTTEASITGAGQIAPRSVLSPTLTNTLPVPVYYDDIAVTDLSYTGGYRWGELSANKWGAPITDPVQSTGEWNIVYVGWGQTQMLIQELTPGVKYEFQIRAVDAAKPPNMSPWSDNKFITASEDLFAPDVPAAPVVASSRIAIQVVHFLGKASGGTYNLPPDLVYLSVHVGGSDSFLADDSNAVGKLIANSGMIQANIPAVGTFQIEQVDGVWVKVIAVDRAGNKSGASNAVQATVTLIDNAHISDLTVTKVTAGTIMAEWIMAGSIKTAQSGSRVELDAAGIKVFNGAGTKSFEAKSIDGSVTMIGKLQTLDSGDGVTIEPGSQPRIKITPNDAYNHNGRLLALNDVGLGTIMDLSIRRTSDDAIDGGKVLLWENGAILSHQPAVGSERYIGINYPVAGAIQLHSSGNNEMLFNNDIGAIEFWGKFPNYVSADAKQAIFTVGDSTAGTGPVIATYTYGPTMARDLWPIISAQASADTFVRVGSHSTTNFTVGLSAAVPHGLHAWCVAM